MHGTCAENGFRSTEDGLMLDPDYKRISPLTPQFQGKELAVCTPYLQRCW